MDEKVVEGLLDLLQQQSALNKHTIECIDDQTHCDCGTPLSLGVVNNTEGLDPSTCGGDVTCPGCGRNRNVGLLHYGAVKGAKPESAYKPLFYWRERINQMCGKDPVVPDEVQQAFASVIQESCVRPYDKSDVAYAVRRLNGSGKSFLDQWGRPSTRWHKWLENWVQLLNRMGEFRPASISGPEVERCETMFKSVYIFFCQIRETHTGRRYMPHYNYVMGRIFELIGRPDLCRYLPALKTRSKRDTLDRIWAYVCDYHDWPKHGEYPYPTYVMHELFPHSFFLAPQ